MAAPLFAVNDYVSALQALMPRGLAWPRDASATQTALLAGLAPSFQRVNADANQLLVDAFPATVDDLIAEWNATLGLPGLTGYTGTDLPTQQQQVVAALTDSGGQSAAYFIDLAARLDLPIAISGYRPYHVNEAVNLPMYGQPWAHAWLVTVLSADDCSALVQLFNLYKPAHTVVIFDVDVAGLSFEKCEDGTFELREDGSYELRE